MIDWSPFVESVRRHQRFVLTSHVRPDCDALGSEMALAAVLESLGKEVLICNAFATPPNLAFIDPARRMRHLGCNITAEEVCQCDVLVILDTSAWAQLGAMGEVIRRFPGRKFIIDHHVSEDDLGAEPLKNTKAEATGRLVVEAADHLGVALSPEAAQAAFCALATDTGWFRFASANAGTYRTAARLIDDGVAPDQVYRQLYENDTIGRLRLIGRTLSRTQTELDGRLIYTWIELADFAATGALPSDSEDIINLTLAVGGTQVAVLFVEQPNGGVKISFRSRCEVDCTKLAEQFNGGGHRKAAGASLSLPPSAARDQVLPVVRAAMQTSDAAPRPAPSADGASRSSDRTASAASASPPR